MANEQNEQNEQNNTGHEISRWLRVGILTLTTLGPVVSAILTWMNERTRALRELRESPYSQQLRERGSALVEQGRAAWQTLIERGNALVEQGRALVEQGNALIEQGQAARQALVEQGNALAEHGSKLSQELLERSSKVTQEAAKRGRAATQDLAARGGQVAENLRGQSVAFWLTFGIGLIAAAAATYLVVRNRLQR